MKAGSSAATGKVPVGVLTGSPFPAIARVTSRPFSCVTIRNSACGQFTRPRTAIFSVMSHVEP